MTSILYKRKKFKFLTQYELPLFQTIPNTCIHKKSHVVKYNIGNILPVNYKIIISKYDTYLGKHATKLSSKDLIVYQLNLLSIQTVCLVSKLPLIVESKYLINM